MTKPLNWSLIGRRLRSAYALLFLGTAAWGAVGGLAGCASQPAKLAPPAPVASVVCLPLKLYTKAQQQQAAQDLAKLPSDSVAAQMVVDYGALRDADRAACSTK